MNLVATIRPAGNVPFDQLLGRLRQMQGRDEHAEALAEVRRHLADDPDQRDLLLIEAKALRHLGQVAEALNVLDRLALLHPNYSRMLQERGLCFVARKEAPAAIASLLAAVNINPALPMSWRMLEGVYRLTGDLPNAATAAAHLSLLDSLPGDIVTATSLFSDGELEPAEVIIRQFLLSHGDHPEGMRLLAKIGIAREVYDDAELLLGGVLAMVPDHLPARFEYSQTLSYRQKFREAEEALSPLLAHDPSSTEYRILASTIAVGLGRHVEAMRLYRELLAEHSCAPPSSDPLVVRARAFAQADLHLWLGHALKTIGEVSSAVQAYRAAAAIRSDFGDAYWSLANLKNYRFTDAELAAMQAAAAALTTREVDRVHFCFALGKAFEDCSAFEESWNWYRHGNRLQRNSSRYRPEIIEQNTQLQSEVCTADFFADRSGWGTPDHDPIFIVGLPRAGSTLIEQILASHSDVEGTQELPNVQRIVQELQGRDPNLDDPLYPGVLRQLSANDFRELGSRYLEETRVLRNGKRFFIDKMPNNFRHIGLIHLMLPNALIIDARREPMACCFSNLKQLFAKGQEFAYSVEDIARYYRTYLKLMAHWDRVLPGCVLRVHHEDVVDDLEGCVRKILDHARLPFQSACVDFHRTQRSIRTPSSEQVRQPIFRHGLDQWTHYRPWLDELHEALGDARFNYR